ncbi:DUF3168 domain-containing protein [Phaeobacter gallaeciensis]|uniref:Gene transfer agent protein n=1 Tax=Phaeobacter gallaeciensis TaxID=60890 RepID=A0AAC9ZA05_9RHOB|nr:DUF3168 domain-containing protein [Phaeobacter gallaeciensis]AHD09316.1 hypothetical protein Gal_01555 [Phaeobacter gallaeciensis DSM 26640]ATE92579.1 putative gene transfer agent protein [Phaeobacter gallaeciensis]ATE97599.1 putative gene transfer agent protein [Phaeobacter gallaeciensis]ATF01244.1 putative gene transfer agent protein [Phaeobacter gallaeciensis]ATF05624.1 putative gene transfer agent protein [Phaeobacter gallaeciensis]
MTYALALPLQEALFQHLSADPDLTAALNGAVYDALPAGTLPQTYVTLGPEEVRDRSDRSGAGAHHRVEINVHTDTAGFAGAKAIAALICDSLTAAASALTLSRGRLVGLWFERANASRNTSGGRQIRLRFAARLEDI